MSLSWTKYWAPSDDGRTLKAADLRNIQDDIDAYITVNPESGTVLTTTDQTISGTKTFTTAPVVPAAFWAAVYPVGIVVTLGVSTNPATLFGFGTWAAIVGKVIVGIDAGQTEFDTLDETGGEKTHLLTGAESGTSAHTHPFTSYAADSGTGAPADAAVYGSPHTMNTNASTAADASSAHNNLQPYIVKYVWQRTA